MSVKIDINRKGLTKEQALQLQFRYGKNELIAAKKETLLHKIAEVLKEPMFLLLIAASVIYFLLGEKRDGAIMLIFVTGIIAIDVIQEWKTDKTLSALKELSAPHIKVIRDGTEKIIASSDLVPGDLMIIEEGTKIPADGCIIECSDLCVDESSLTGESEGVWKSAYDQDRSNDEPWRRDFCYAGTLVTQGSALIFVESIGALTEYGKIGANAASAPEEATPLQKQTGKLVRLSGMFAAVLFVLVGTATFFNIADHMLKERIIESILSGITLAMAMIPEEFPVILTVFLSMGAWRLARKKSLVRKLPAVETLGAVSVLCVDKTGTITLNQMTVTETWAPTGDSDTLCEVMGLACEIKAYDPMEKAMLAYCGSIQVSEAHLFGGTFLKEYPFTNETKRMGHVWLHDGEYIIAAKGSPERIVELCDLSAEELADSDAQLAAMSAKGLRVIAVGQMKVNAEADIPNSLEDCRLDFCGLIGLTDPPRPSIAADIRRCAKAGVRVVMITGDNGITAGAIAKQIGMENADEMLTGAQLDAMSDEQLREKVRAINLFARVVPEHKMRIVKALKENGEIVAMTGDGVNDAPALKYADIGIAMGKRGSEVSREAADLILLDDNFSTIVDTIRDGRRIFDNIRKAVGYVFTIHIPIALASLLAPLLGIDPSGLLLLPLHVVLLELVIDPTCSIVLERQPAEKDIMERVPRDPKEPIFTGKNLFKSVVQGLVIFAASFGAYSVSYLKLGQTPETARAMGLAVIFLSNLFLVQVNSSDTQYAFRSFLSLLGDKVMWIVNLGTLAGLLVILYSPLNAFLKLAPLSLLQLGAVLGISFAAVMWYEGVKLVKNRSKHKNV